MIEGNTFSPSRFTRLSIKKNTTDRWIAEMMVMALTNEGGYHYVVSQTKIEFVYKNFIYIALLVHCQEYRNEPSEAYETT
jgi:hypothetical protein